MSLWLFFVLIAASLLTTLPVCNSRLTYYVLPSNAPNNYCPGEPCHDLDYYAEYASTLLSRKNASVALLFLGGTHFLTKTLEIHNTVSLRMSGIVTPQDVSLSVVNISAGIGMKFFHLTDLLMRNLTFVSNKNQLQCVYNSSVRVPFYATNIERFSQKYVIAACCNLQLSLVSEVELHHSQYPSNSLIFITNTYTETISYAAHTLCSDFTFSVLLEISHCLFLNGSDFEVVFDNQNMTQFFNGSISDTSGFSINFHVRDEHHIRLIIENCLRFGDDEALMVKGSFSTNNYSFFELIINSCPVSVIQLFSDNNKPKLNCFLSLMNCTLFKSKLQSNSFSDIALNNCSLQSTTVYFTTIRECRFTYLTSNDSSFYVGGPSRVNVKDSKFFSGNPSLFRSMPMQSSFITSQVDLTFLGRVLFENNTGYQGGALYMFNSYLYLAMGARVIFTNNTAYDKGGAIYVDNPMYDGFTLPIDIVPPSKCAIGLNYNLESGFKPNSSIVFSRNNASNRGNDLYGFSLKSGCTVSQDKATHSYEVQKEIFIFSNESRFSISSEPKRVCLCENSIPQCANYSYIYLERQFAPGEKINISLSIVGYDFGVTIGTLYLLSLSSNNGIYSVKEQHQIQEVKSISIPTCTDVEYTVRSENERGSVLYFLTTTVINTLETMEQEFNSIYESVNRFMIIKEIDNILATTPVIINITIMDCPLGFAFNHSSQVCQCTIPPEKLFGTTKCMIVNGKGVVYRNGTTWVSATMWPLVSSKSVEIFFYDYCPYGYCNTTEMALNLQQPDSQCALNHAGILCGGCATNMSRVLGSHNCLPCSGDEHVAITLAFIFAGIFLILFIKFFNFTITLGMLNGLILYANILWTSQSVFFPFNHQQTSLLFHFFTTFIAWINLDLGIQTCFIPGLDMYWKTWLQFLFPLYIWSLAGLIILACHFSVIITRLFGTNSVHVLATMFLLSYSKILCTIITSLGFALLNYQNETRIVWLADGNLPYFELPHSFLFVAALLFLIVFWIPYTATILLVPCLRRHFNIACINKLTPFYDAHFGPLKDKHQYWIGLTLLVRVILAVSEIAVQAIDPTINIYITIIVSTFLCLIVCIVYKKWYLSFLEASFLVNLIILSCGFLYSRDGHTRFILTSVSVGVAFITFLVILFSQGLARIKSFCLYIRTACFHRGYEDLDTVSEPESDARNSPTQSVVSVGGIQSQDHVSFREPLLDDS